MGNRLVLRNKSFYHRVLVPLQHDRAPQRPAMLGCEQTIHHLGVQYEPGALDEALKRLGAIGLECRQ